MRVSLKNFVVPSIPLAVFLVAMCFVIWMSAFIGTPYSTDTTLNTSIVRSLQSVFSPDSLISNLICYALTLLNAFLVAQINNRFTIIRTRTFLPIIIFLILISTWNQTHIMMASHLALTLFIFALFYFFTMSRDRKASEQAFMGSFLISISSILINPLIFIIPVCWIGFMMFQSFSLRTFLASIFGTITPWILYTSVLYMIHPDFDFSTLINIYYSIDLNFSTFSLPEIIYTLSMGLILIIGLIGMFSVSNSDAIKTRNKLNFLLFLFVSVIIVSFIFSNQIKSFLPIIGLVYALLISHPLTLKQNNFYGILFIIFCLINIAFVISKYFIF
jgi:hypothetical protein